MIKYFIIKVCGLFMKNKILVYIELLELVFKEFKEEEIQEMCAIFILQNFGKNFFYIRAISGFSIQDIGSFVLLCLSLFKFS